MLLTSLIDKENVMGEEIEMLLSHLFGHYFCSPCLASVLLEAILDDPWVKNMALAAKLDADPNACRLECFLI